MAADRNQKRRADILRRVSKPDEMYKYCRVLGCRQTATAGTGEGLNQRFCRKHEEHYDRHGSPYKGSYGAVVLNPQRKAARAWIELHEADLEVGLAVKAVEALYQSAGRRIEAFRLAGLPPAERAKAIWAGLREGKVDARDALAVWLAVEAVIWSDPQVDPKLEFKQVQAAKVLHRMAGGEHRSWERSNAQGGVLVTKMHKYPHSRGLVLRHLGEQLGQAAQMVITPFFGRVGLEKIEVTSAKSLPF